jgi:hypothetical protein
MTKNEPKPMVAYDYLMDMPDEQDDALSVSIQFNNILMGHTALKEIDGVEAQRTKFSAQGFPKQNLDEFLFIPLYINPKRRMAYLQAYSGDATPPDCQSIDGVTPAQPLLYNNMQITSCIGCPLAGYGKDAKCKERGAMVGLAYFEDTKTLVPVRKDVGGLSIKAFQQLSADLASPVDLGNGYKNLPIHTRLVKCKIEIRESNFGRTPTWAFEVLKDKFVPPDLFGEVEKIKPLARSFVKADAPRTALLAAPQETKALTGEVSIDVVTAEQAANCF